MGRANIQFPSSGGMGNYINPRTVSVKGSDMKDKVFIAWSGSNEVALKVKRILEKERKYICSIGGNSDNSSTFSSVGDTVIQQIKVCNQAIVIFQNRKDGMVSNNLFFELGYVLAKYGQMKIHCVRREGEPVTLPSDFDNSFVEVIQDDGDDDIFAEKIVEYFSKRQKMSVNTNKMYLINNRYIAHDYIMSHYSDTGSKCSDYELAQHVLFYAEAAYLFSDSVKVHDELLKFKNSNEFEFSAELSIAVNLAIVYLNLINESKTSDEGLYYVEKRTFLDSRKSFEHLLESIEPDDSGVFGDWATVIATKNLAYAYMLFANNKAIDDSMRRTLYGRSIEMAQSSLEAMEGLCDLPSIKESKDDIGLINLFKSYVYGNDYMARKYLNEDGEIASLKKSLDCCSELKELYGSGTVDTKLFSTIHMRYYLLLSEYLTYDDGSIDEFDMMMYKADIDDFIEQVVKEDTSRTFLDRIKMSRRIIGNPDAERTVPHLTMCGDAPGT